MIIQTKDFGLVEISEDDIIQFSEGLYAFEGVNKFVILQPDGEDDILRLQAVESENPRFVIFNPHTVVGDYNPILPADALAKLKSESVDELSFFVIAVIPSDIYNATVNLKSPVVVNFKEKLGLQVILDGSTYSIRHRLFGGDGRGN